MKFVHPVSIKPFLKRYLAYYHPVEPYFKLTEKNRYGNYLISSLRFKTKTAAEPFEYIINGSDTLKVAIPEHYERNFGVVISKRHQYRFNQILLDEFHEKMVEYVYPKLTGRKGEIRMCLLAFREKFSIPEDDLPYKTLEKMYERERYRATSWESYA